MSESHLATADFTLQQQLKVQHLDISGFDHEMYNVSSPAAIINVALGSSENFAILAYSAISNTGSSVVTGDIGLFPGSSVTGFPPGIVNGTQHITDAAAQNARIDAANAYTLLAAYPSYTTISGVLDGQTLSPGYYSESGAGSPATFNLATSGPGTLTLDAGGNSNALFVFKASSTLITGAGGLPTISLINGAQASNVFWLVGSSATINSGTAGTFNGTILAYASITDTMGGIVNGRLLAVGGGNGAVTLSAATVLNRTASGSSGSIVIHVGEYVTKVYKANCKVDLTNSVTEFNQANFTIQDSAGPGGRSLYDTTTKTWSSDQSDLVISGIAGLADNDDLSVYYTTQY